MRRTPARFLLLALTLFTAGAAQAAAAERLCDPGAEDCRAILLDLIRNEPSAIDVAFWFMQDGRYANEIVKRAQAGVRVRVLVDPRANASYSVNAEILAQLAAAGIPMRQRVGNGILHWKMMLFAGQRTVEFSGANFSPDGLVYSQPYQNYVDESVFFSDDPAIVQSFMRRYDDLWVDTTNYADYANISGTPSRVYATYSIDPSLNFPPLQGYRARAVARYKAETAGIDAIMYRITDRAHSDAMIQAVQRGVPVRVIVEQEEYRNPSRLWDAWNIDRMYTAGVQIRQRGHLGLNHQKSVVLRGQGMVIFGSSNWTSPSSDSQEEHNYFTTKGWILSWFESQFDRKWNNLAPSPETQPFHPLPPGKPVNAAPAYGAVNVSTAPVLTFDAGPFAHLYDIYLGTSPDPPLFAADVPLGPTTSARSPRQYQLPQLATGTTYYWRVVAKTMAVQATAGPIWSFTTSTTPSPDPAPAPPPPPPAPAPAPAPAPSASPQPAMAIDLPANDGAVRQPFAVAGWAVDTAASRGTGVDAIHVYAYPNPGSGAAPVFLGAATLGGARPDVAAFFGASFVASGYGLVVRGLAPGNYLLVVFARSSVAGTFAIARTANFRVEPSTMLVLDAPVTGAAVGSAFLVGGWTLDAAAASGSGVDLVHVYAYPLDTGAPPVFLGSTRVGIQRPDVAAIFGAEFSRAGFNLLATGLPPGRYRIVAYGRSLVTGVFSASGFADVMVR